MAFSRIKYDGCQYKQQIKRSADVGEYHLFASAHESCDQCFSFTGPLGSSNDASVARKGNNIDFGLKADAESHLTNRALPHGECNDIGSNDKYKSLNNTLVDARDCSSNFNSVDTRFTHPLDIYRGMNTTEYKFNPFLHVNPQCQYYTDRNGTNTRLIAKDTYRTPKQKILDTGGALPSDKRIIINDSCDVCN